MKKKIFDDETGDERRTAVPNHRLDWQILN